MFNLNKGLQAAALFERIRDATERSHRRATKAIVKRVRGEWKEQIAQPLAEPPETVTNLEMAAT